jgi:pimeloyl-ACP methyl ester carboxylesterase
VAITKKQRLVGHVSQMAAGLTHHVSAERLGRIGERVPRVAIVVGDEDNLVWRTGSVRLKAAMRGASLEEWRGTGHGIQSQRDREFNLLVERTVRGR